MRKQQMQACAQRATTQKHAAQFGRTVLRTSVSVLLLSLGCRLASTQQAARLAAASQQQQVRQAAALAAQGNVSQAMQIAERILAQHPEYTPALKLKAMLLERAGSEMEAVVLYEHALKLAPNDPDLLLKAGVYKLRAQQITEAIGLLERCARILPADGDVHYYLAQAYHLNGQNDLALAAIRQSAKADPGNAFILQKYGELLCSSGDFDKGLAVLQSAQAKDASLPHLDYDLGWANYNRMDLVQASEYAASAVRKQPDDPNALLLLAMAQFKQQHWPQAKDAYERLSLLHSASAEQLQNLGRCELELRNYPLAEEHLVAALRMDPTLLLARYSLSRVYAFLGRTAEAQHQASLHRLMMERETFVRTIATEQREAAITPQARELLKSRQEDAALRLYQTHFKGNAATIADARVFIGKLQLYMGSTDDGLRNLHLALKLKPTVHEAHTTLGILALGKGDLAGAESEFRAELALDPNAQSAIAELGEVRYRQQRWAEAEQQLTRSHTMTPELLYFLADAQFHLGKAQDALLSAELSAIYAHGNAALLQALITLVRINDQPEAAQRLAASLESAPAN